MTRRRPRMIPTETLVVIYLGAVCVLALVGAAVHPGQVWP